MQSDGFSVSHASLCLSHEPSTQCESAMTCHEDHLVDTLLNHTGRYLFKTIGCGEINFLLLTPPDLSNSLQIFLPHRCSSTRHCRHRGS